MQRIGSSVFGLLRGGLSGISNGGGGSLMERCRNLSTLCSSAPSLGLLAPTNPLALTFVRTIIRNHFPRPKETKRIRSHGWNTRMKTKGGRAIIMRRILKGRFCLTH